MTNLFGDEVPEPRRPEEPAVQVSLIDAAAERRAYESGRPRSQERTEILCAPVQPREGGVRLTPDGPDITDGGIYRILG